MAIQLTIEYEQVVKLVEQLSDEQREQLLAKLLTKISEKRQLTNEEKSAY